MRKGLKTKSYEDTSFVVGDSPVTHDVNGDLGWNGAMGYIICDGAGDIKVQFSTDGANLGNTWGDKHTMKSGEKMDLTGIDIHAIKITHVADSAYRILIC